MITGKISYTCRRKENCPCFEVETHDCSFNDLNFLKGNVCAIMAPCCNGIVIVYACKYLTCAYVVNMCVCN